MTQVRSKIYIDKTVQGAIAKRIILHWFVFFALMGLSLFTLEFFLGNSQLSVLGHVGAVWGKYSFFFILMLAVMPTFIYDTMKLSHRFAGPVLRLKESLKRLADDGQVSNLKFRENDFWRELSDDFNRVAERVSKVPVSKVPASEIPAKTE